MITRKYENKSTVFHVTIDELSQPTVTIISEHDYHIDEKDVPYLQSIYPKLNYKSGVSLPLSDFFDALESDIHEGCLDDICVKTKGIDKYITIGDREIKMKDLYLLFAKLLDENS